MSANILSINGLTKSFGSRVILDRVTLGLDASEKVGVIGANGAGKSTLLRIMAGLDTPDEGEVAVRRGATVGFLPQEPELDESKTVRQVLEEPFAELLATMSAYERAAAEMSSDAGVLLEQIERLGGWDFQHRIHRVAMEVGLSGLDAEVRILSGGQRKRAALARVVLETPDLLLMDEPTNHLDAVTVDWLEEWLRTTHATVVLVTHDRYFLDSVVTRLIELRDAALRVYPGDYTDYLAARALEEARRERIQHRRLRMLMSELEWARRSPKARTTKSKKRLERIDDARDEVARLSKQAFQAEVSIGKATALHGTILELHDVSMAYDDGPPLISGLTLHLRRGERLGILGTNGAGKTTLLKLVAGELEPLAGRVVRGVNTRVAVFDQQRSVLEQGATVRDIVAPDGGDTVAPGGGERVHVAAWLDRFGFAKESHERPVSTLSGGERNRLALARFLLEDANLLLLDEPTNDLDIATLCALEEAIASFEGCVLVVSHDRYFLDKVATGIIAFERELTGVGSVTLVQGGYSDYRTIRLERLRAEQAESARLRADEERKERTASRKDQRPRGRKPLTWDEERELAGIEPRIEAAEADVARLEREVSAPELWAAGIEAGRERTTELTRCKEALAALYERWEDLAMRLEQG